MPSKKSILKGLVNGTVTELYPKTSADNVFAASGTDIETLLTTIPTTETVNSLISAAIDDLIDGAPATYDTLKEIADWIATHQSEYEALIAAIAGKVDKVTGKDLSTNDFTDAYKTKLDGIEANANAYTLPQASASTLGGIKVGDNLAIDSSTGALSGNYSAATTSANGLMSSTDKSKLDGIETNANNYTLPAATTSALGGVQVGSNLAVDANGVISGNYSNATTSAAGLMSAADKTALNAKPDIYVQSTQPSGLKAGDLWFEIPSES